MTPARGKVLVRPIETPETLAHGRILLTQRTREDLTSQQMEVIAVGAPMVCEDEDCERPHCTITERGWDYLQTFRGHDHDVSGGDWVLVAHRSLGETDTDSIFICREDDILAILHAPTL